jgi:hypothetical protein
MLIIKNSSIKAQKYFKYLKYSGKLSIKIETNDKI